MDPVTLLISKRFASERAYGAAKAALEAASGGQCTILRTNKGQWSYVRRLARFNVEDVAADLGTGTHEAFIRPTVHLEGDQNGC